ncbi:MAG: hypothetical protein WBB26_11365 [Saprospiraceae bacterium]
MSIKITYKYKDSVKLIILFILLLVTLYTRLNAQNLVTNGDFESHKEMNLKESFHFANSCGNLHKLNNWQKLGFQHLYVNTKAPWIKTGWRVDSEYPKDLEPHSGNGMVQLCYEESGPIDRDEHGQRPQIGITSYLKAKLSKTLEVGKVYNLSMWVYVPNWYGLDSAMLDNIGLCLLRKDVFMSMHNMLNFNRIFTKKLVCDQWQKMEFNIIPTCELNYLVIGAFRTKNFPKLHRNDQFYYHDMFIDDVECVELDSATAMAQKSIYHCRENEVEEDKLSVDYFDSLVINYKNNEFVLSEDQKKNIKLLKL